jgi:sec-independent protein translocase protein TatA
MTFPGGTELIIILVIVLVLFGGAKLPGLARSLGQSITEFRKASNEAQEAEAEQQRAEEEDRKGSDSSSERDTDS